MNDQENNDRFIDRMRSGELNAEDVAALELRLSADAGERRRYRARMRLEANLLSAFQTDRPEIVPPLMDVAGHRIASPWWPVVGGVGIAAALILGIFIALKPTQQQSPPPIARIESAEEAAWVSSQPTLVGSDLAPGEIQLKSGLAEIRVRSGAIVAL